MIALDTNILVRLLTRDDDKQAEKVRILFETHAENNDQFFVSDMVLAELAWTLERTYRFDRAAISKTFRALAENATLGFQSREVLQLAHAALQTFRCCSVTVIAPYACSRHGCASPL